VQHITSSQWLLHELHEFTIIAYVCIGFLASVTLHGHNNWRPSNFPIRYRVCTNNCRRSNQFWKLVLHFEGMYILELFTDVGRDETQSESAEWQTWSTLPFCRMPNKPRELPYIGRGTAGHHRYPLSEDLMHCKGAKRKSQKLNKTGLNLYILSLLRIVMYCAISFNSALTWLFSKKKNQNK
jgi:hypothetical protein